MKIHITEESLDLFRDLGIPADMAGSAIVVIESMMNGNIAILDRFDEENSNKQALTVYKQLEMAGMLHYTPEHPTLFSLTDAAITLMESLENREPEPPKTDEWIEEYRQLWINPQTGKYFTTPDKRSLGASVKDLSGKMKKFLSEYREIFKSMPRELTPEKVILEATKAYVTEYKKVAFAYCKDSYNFIMKQEGSTKDTTRSLLATACENYISGYSHIQEEPSVRNKSVN